MKKPFLFFCVALLFLTGCSRAKVQETTVNNPYEILVDNEIFSYFDTKENIPKIFNVLDISLDNHQNINNNVLVNSDSIIRCISIVDKTITTYKQISVGDDISEIKDKFSHEYQSGNNYMVIFNDISEEDPTNQSKEDNWLWINYITNGSKITQIQIYDVKYGSEMR